MANQGTQFDYDQHAVRRMQIENDPKLKLHLQEWEEEKKQVLLSVESYRGRCIAVKSELYQLIGFYSVFQGVVFTASATASKVTCHSSFCPALLSLLVSVATAFSVHEKLTYYDEQKGKFLTAESRKAATDNKIALLRGRGKEFDFSTINDDVKNAAEDLKRKKKKEEEARRHVHSAVMGFLGIFSVIILGSCILVLCWT